MNTRKLNFGGLKNEPLDALFGFGYGGWACTIGHIQGLVKCGIKTTNNPTGSQGLTTARFGVIITHRQQKAVYIF